MAMVLGVNAAFHDPAAALVLDGRTLAAIEEERFSRRKHGKRPVPFSTWELPERAIGFCLESAGVDETKLDAIAYSYDPSLVDQRVPADVTSDDWEGLRTLYVERAPRFLGTLLPRLDLDAVRFVPHHVAHAASGWGAAPFDTCAVMVLDGRGETCSYIAGTYRDGGFNTLARQELPHSLGLWYESLTEHLGFRRSSDEYKVMALASYGEPVHLREFRRLVHGDGSGGFRTHPIDWNAFAPPGRGDQGIERAHADLANSVQRRLEEVVLELAAWLRRRSGERRLAMAGGVALNCVANSRLYEEGPFDDIWVQPAAGDSGTALGAALHVATALGDTPQPFETAALGSASNDDEIEAALRAAGIAFERPDDIAEAAAAELADDGLVAWVQGRSEFGPRALGHRSLLAHPAHRGNLERINDVKGREQFRPVAPMVMLEAAKDLFDGGPIPSPYMLFTHRVDPGWAPRIPAVVHVDGTARIQTVDAGDEPLVHRMLSAFERRTGLPVVVNTSLNTAGRPMVEDVRDALECFGSSPIDLLAIGPFAVRRHYTPEDIR